MADSNSMVKHEDFALLNLFFMVKGYISKQKITKY